MTTECVNRNIPVKSKETKTDLIGKLELHDRLDLRGKLTPRQRRRLAKKGGS